MKYPIIKSMLLGLVISLPRSGLGLQNDAVAGATLKVYYEENAQVQLISPEGSIILIDVHDPNALSSPPIAKDVLLTTQNHGAHRRLDFVSSFPCEKLDVKTGEIKLKDATIRGITSAHIEGYEFRDEGGSNYILRILKRSSLFAVWG
jgi:hypothetical protein